MEVRFVCCSRDTVTFERDLKIIYQTLLVKQSSCKLSLYTANCVSDKKLFIGSLLTYWLTHSVRNRVSYKAEANLYPTKYSSSLCQEYDCGDNPLKSRNNDSFIDDDAFSPTIK